jgi:Clp protease
MVRRIASLLLMAAVAIVATAALAPTLAADIASEALSVTVDPVNPRYFLIQSVVDIIGQIEPGDDAKLKSAFIDVWTRRNALIEERHLKLYTKHNIIYLSSPGGEVNAALELVKVLKQVETTGPTMVAVKGTCASACTIILFSAETRFARLCDKIGVHRAGFTGVEENSVTFSASTEIADYLIKGGVPWAIVKQMLLTSASNIAWLTLAETQLAKLSVLPGRCPTSR